MPFYRCKLVIIPLVIIASFLAWLSYLWAVENYRPSLKQTQAFTEITDQAQTFMLQNNLSGIEISNGAVWPESLRSEPFIDRLTADIARVNKGIEHVLFLYKCDDKCYFTAYFYFDLQDEFVPGPYRYIQYNPDGHLQEIVSPEYRQNRLTEHMQLNPMGWSEEFVPSISEVIKERVSSGYFFCEPLEQEHWHFCRGEYD
ncbi:hypothetical protein EHLJMEHL_03718 [Vreelandella titanicae]